ncbi:hypothetical protein [Pseudomonas sp. JR33AA]|uniref:hypothetical protein n=1 Tax=Pseudomonas sp. JR33AA TaxID=2899113 RepID=UPI001F1F6C17|nr:hypothetical protein [Pseudomonas sp. JR33AA]MCE5975630.1 hypothetical protein [Pseudomonas sp. JR33AA]
MTVVALVIRETARPWSFEPGEPEGFVHSVPLDKPLSTAALIVAFGFSAPDGQPAGRADLVLKACFIPSRGEARALVGGRDGDALYRVGDRLPDGSVVRRIEVRSITLWDGRVEQSVAMSGNRPGVFLPFGSAAVAGPAPADSPRLLREVQ